MLTLLRAHREESALYDNVHYWAPAQAAHTEVDFVLDRGGEHLVLEVKSGRRLTNRMLTGLRAVRELDGLVRRILVYGGSDAIRTEDGIDVWPLTTLFDALDRKTLWP